ncbi:hypothetical protein BS50DRAFT_623420 [Corynespora cassiicola Philippines]|uniref:RRM domain-containing protein n=1 Tax=Corynespora cassiicola Philippines TaxID=1448308 RepID=A0A2T2NE52_CORCC|nr:hypothetical protein BS50DRAFT_623420 [Corynespora cassiicola Philippines]
MTDASRLKATVFVGGLTPRVRQSDLLNYFMPFGDIVEINLPKPENPNSHEVHRGFGYIEFESAEDAIEAIDNMDRSEIDGQVIKVAAAKPQKQQNEGLGSKTAVWEQEGWLAENAVTEEDRQVAEGKPAAREDGPMDPMQGLEGLDEAGPKPV